MAFLHSLDRVLPFHYSDTNVGFRRNRSSLETHVDEPPTAIEQMKISTLSKLIAQKNTKTLTKALGRLQAVSPGVG